MKIKQITSLSLVLAMLVLSTSCGKSPSVNSNLPTPKSQASNLNQDLIPEESFSIYKWIKNHLLWATTVAVGATYVGINEWRHYSERKAIADIDTKATTATTKSADAAQAAEEALNTANSFDQRITTTDGKADAAIRTSNSADGKSNSALTKAAEALLHIANVNDKIETHKKNNKIHVQPKLSNPPQGVPGGTPKDDSKKDVQPDLKADPESSQKK
jgi:hypothetical protein